MEPGFVDARLREVKDAADALHALRVAEQLCAQLAFVGTERCKFSAHVRVALLEDVFTRLLPAPIGPPAWRAAEATRPKFQREQTFSAGGECPNCNSLRSLRQSEVFLFWYLVITPNSPRPI